MIQPKSIVQFDRNSFDRLKSRVNNIARSRRGLKIDPAFATNVPTQIGIKMNNGCNLRCIHCYEWNRDGYHQIMDKSEKKNEIPLALIDKVMVATHAEQAKLYLWGGEPLMYSQFDGFMRLLEKDPRWTTICTNAILTEKRLDSMLRASECLAFLASVDGLHEKNDVIRGKGTFKKVVAALELLLEQRRKGTFKGAISISLTINDAVIGNLYEFVEYFENLGVDSVYMVFPWFIPDDVATSMDHFVADKLPDLAGQIPDWNKTSWHSFTYKISPEKLPELKDDISRIAARSWGVRVRFHPALTAQEIDSFVRGEPAPAEGKTQCTAITNRIDLLPNGDVVSCKFFPELKMGNVSNASIQDVWHGAQFSSFREKLACGLSPVCSKCTLLYSTG